MRIFESAPEKIPVSTVLTGPPWYIRSETRKGAGPLRQRKKFAVLALSAAVLAGAWLLAEYMDRAPAAEALAREEPSPEPIDLSVGRARELTALSWSWEGQTVNLAWDEETARWVNADDETCPVDSAAASALAKAAASVRASMAIRDATDLTQYGLDRPALTVMAATEEDIAAYAVGNMSITGEYYIRRDGEDTVYLEEGALAAFRVGVEDILTLESVPDDVGTVTGLSVISEAGDYELRYRDEPEPGWYREEGDRAVPLEEDRVRALYEALLDTSFSACVTWDGAAEEYGLDEPQVRAELTYVDTAGRDAAFTLEFGDYAGREVFVRFPGSDMVYLTAAAVPDGLMYPDWAAMEPATVLTLNTADLSELHVELGDGSWDILRLEETTERPVGEETVSVTDVIYSANGWVLDTGAVEDWLAALAGLTAEDAAPAGEGRQTLLSVELTWKDPEGVPAELELRNYDSARDLCVVGGDRYLLVSREAAEAVLAAAAELFTTE